MSAIPHTPDQEQEVVDMLMREHREVERLLDRIARTEQQPDGRDIADQVIAMLVKHSVAEEILVYPVMEDHFENGCEEVAHDKEEHNVSRAAQATRGTPA